MRNFDYAQAGFYFITVCVRDRKCLLGDCSDGVMRPNDVGRLVEEVWINLPKHYSHVALDRHILMPNHFHAILILAAQQEHDSAVDCRRHGLPEIMRAFKTFSARRINLTEQTPGISFWQRGYFERVIRDELEHARIAEYINNNPANWCDDSLNPARDNP